MAAKKSSGKKPTKTSNPSRSQGGEKLAKAAFTNPGQRAKVAPREKKNDTRVGNVSKGGRTTRGAGVQGSPGFQKKSAGQIANAALLVTLTPGTGIPKQIVGRISQKVGQRVGLATFDEAAKGIWEMRGGGKVSRVSTPFGKTLGSTKIMTEAQKDASRIGLIQRANNISAAAGVEAMNIVKGAARLGGRGAKGASAAYLVSQGYKNKNKKKK